MGSRVNWIVVRSGQVVNRRLDGGAGLGLDYILGAGPEIAVSHFDGQGETGWWTDDVCEGGALIDADARRLLFFTVQPWAAPASDRCAYRAAMLEGYARVWPGWRVEWAADGLADLARYLGEDPVVVRAGTRAEPAQVWNDGDALPPPRLDQARAELARRIETFVPADAGLRVMHAVLKAGHNSRTAVPAMEAARHAARPAAAAAAALIRAR